MGTRARGASARTSLRSGEKRSGSNFSGSVKPCAARRGGGGAARTARPEVTGIVYVHQQPRAQPCHLRRSCLRGLAGEWQTRPLVQAEEALDLLAHWQAPTVLPRTLPIKAPTCMLAALMLGTMSEPLGTTKLSVSA